MKKILLICVALTSMIAFAQNDIPALQEKLIGFLTEKEQQKDSLRDTRNYMDIIGLIGEEIDCLNSLPKEMNQFSHQLKSGIFYDLACYQSLLNNESNAIAALDSACAYGYQDFRHMEEDTDLDNIRSLPEYLRILDNLKSKYDYLKILKESAPYRTDSRTDTLGTFTYLPPQDSDLMRVREYFKLDSVAGNGDEISRIKNILTYIHNLIQHDGQHANPPVANAIEMAKACKDGSRGLNCRGLATVLNECYLSMGIPSRFITCMPKYYVNDCHVINAVYSRDKGKWLWMDPTQNAWVTDENGNELGIDEVRQRIIDGRPLRLNEEANWNNRNKATIEEYIYDYMAKNLYYLISNQIHAFQTEGKDIKGNHYILLCPQGFMPEISTNGIITTDNEWFWQAPDLAE